ncbi:MAG TPA: antitoxin Xre/MbcA/ParS toxin-binding domain-containing protein [Thermoanaerobaculia bacterium]|nr:antitoxin Xre/MbcA/ParS toxin-binding domain-containing protein [Thermoanaerobaculia bacterium]
MAELQPSAPARETPDVLAYRRFIARGKPGPHSYVVLIGRKVYGTRALLESVEEGLPFSAFEHLQRNLALPAAELAELVQIRPRTLARRKEQGRFEPDESDRLLRASRLLAQALELFEGDAAAARAWLAAPQPALGGATPLSVARTDTGSREVEKLVGRLEHGVFS